MKKLNEEIALSILLANTKKKKRNIDLLTIGRSCEYLVNLYGSRKAVAEKIGLHAEMIREFLTILQLPLEIQKLASEGKIDSIDVIREISAIKEPSKQIAAAYALIDSSSKDVRDIKRLIKGTNLPVRDAKKAVLDAKPKGLHIFVVDFDDETHQAILEQAKALRIKPAELVRDIVENWFRRKTRR